MTLFSETISDVVAGDDLDVKRTITNIPATQTLTKAWLTFKTKPSDADPGLLQKVIAPGAVVGQGQITDTGASGTGSLLFQLSQANTLALPVGIDVHYDIKVLTSAGKIYTASQGVYLSAARVTAATS